MARTHRILVLTLSLVIASCSASSFAADWWTISDQEFVEQYADLATGTQQERSRFAWMLFARVNQPAGTSSAGQQILAWELWASNAETFTHDPKWPDDGERNEIEFTVAKAQIPKAGGEEVVRNRLSFDYITNPERPLFTVAGLDAVFADKTTIDFPLGAIEIKANWTINGNKTFWGAPAPVEPDMYQVESQGINHGLNGMHIMAKIAKTPSDPFFDGGVSWFWTTFEYKDNPGREEAIRFITHPDALTPEQVKEILTEAGLEGNIAESYVNNGTQLHFVDPDSGNDVLLGNTTMEDFALAPQSSGPDGWTAWTTSCHTCHGQTRMESSTPPRFDFVPQNGPIGEIVPSVVEGTWPLDFVWSVPDRAVND